MAKTRRLNFIKADLAIFVMFVSLIIASGILLSGSLYLAPILVLETLCLVGCIFALKYAKR